MSLDETREFDDEDLYAFTDIDWLAIHCSDVAVVADALSLENIRRGSWDDLNELTNTFIFSSQRKRDWIIVLHQWEPRGSSEQYLNALEQILIELSQRFSYAQSFSGYEDVIAYTHWVSAQNGEIIRSFARGGETNLYRNFGAITAAEQFLDWEDDNLFPDLGDAIKIALQWSVEPIHTDYAADIIAVVGYKILISEV